MMNRIKAFIRNFFAFSRKETNAFLILLPLLVLLIFSEPIYRYFFVRQKQDFSQEQKKLDSLVNNMTDSAQLEQVSPAPNEQITPFDPNNASVEQLEANGFSESLASRVVSYRTKGGKFLIKKDLLKIYGLDRSLFDRLYPHILLPVQLASKNPQEASIAKKLNHETIMVDINRADTAQLKRVYGIGDKLAERIVKYREKLGGFVSMDQLNEVYGLDSTVVEDAVKDFFVSSDFRPKQIRINSAKQEELSNHPYINRALARMIEAYRFQHGNFAQPEDLAKIQMMKEPTLTKLKPYLSFDP